MKSNRSSGKTETRREVLQKMVYAAPVVATMVAAPAFAQTGSARRQDGWRRKRSALDASSPARQV